MDERRAEPSAGEPEPDVPEQRNSVPPEPLRDAAASDKARPTHHRSTAAAWLVLVLVLLIVGAATSPWWAPPLAPLLPWADTTGISDRSAQQQIGAIAGRLAQLEQRDAPPDAFDKTFDKISEGLAAFERRLVALEKQSGQRDTGAGADLTALEQAAQRADAAQAQLADRVGALESKKPAVDPAAVQALQGNVAKLGAALAALSERLDKLTAAGPDDSRTDQALVLALGQLRQAMAGSAPFGDALVAASGLAQNRPEVKAALSSLSDAAAHGVPSTAILRERFERIAGEIANANETPSADWGSWITSRLRSIFAVRRVGAGAVGDSPEGIVATAEGALQAGDLAGAGAALGSLRGAAAATAKPWLDEAQRRLDAEAALAKASDLVTAHLAQGPTAPEKQP
jgi:hypothetical protein